MKIKVKIIGAGGIGGCLVENLCRLLNYGCSLYSFDDAEVAIIDGDQYEERNRPRQAFQERGNKAEVTAKTLEEKFPNLFFRAHPAYIDEGNIGMFLQEGDVVFLCVDNHATRRLVSRYCEDELQNCVLISGGNNEYDGNMQIFIRKDGWNITPSLEQHHSEIAHPTDKHPNEIEKREGCLEQQAADPQLLVANNMAAAHMLNAFHGWLTGIFTPGSELYHHSYDEVHFDIRDNKAKSKCWVHKEENDTVEGKIKKALSQRKVSKAIHS
jgi:molybdopterin/thiamine biosynthesis adenylyltransferase